MWPVLILVAIVSLTGYFSMADQVRNPVVRVADSGDLAANMRVYRRALLDFARANPGASGAIPDASLQFPSWYKRNPLWNNVVSGGTVTVYARSRPTHSITQDIVAMSGNSVYAGEANASTHTLYSPVIGQTTISIPTVIPNGVPVWISSIN